ncbi:MAG: hypothetical protein L3K26_10415 [Candidatus Hydrogenedentes bacterium]|nr:hypothetical protein [Candidatus Hydrogenedentota bacterium]
MGLETEELIQILDQMIELLREDGETHWRKWAATAKSRLLRADFSGIEYVLRGYGGMGSFSDLVIGQSSVAGEFRWKAGYRENNDTLDRLRGEAFRLANFIKRNHEIDRT